MGWWVQKIPSRVCTWVSLDVKGRFVIRVADLLNSCPAARIPNRPPGENAITGVSGPRIDSCPASPTFVLGFKGGEAEQLR